MKKTLFQIILMVLCITAKAQKVSNVRAEQRGQEIVVFYSLETSSPCEVSLVLSQDNGATWSRAVKNVSGDVGKNINAGEKQITWKGLEEHEQLVGDQFQFSVVIDFSLPLLYTSEEASFPGGIEALHKLLRENLVYPEEMKQKNIEGTVCIGFAIEPDGKVSNFSVKYGRHEILDSCALKICMKVMSDVKWNPAKQNGNPVRTYTSIPIKFSIESDGDFEYPLVFVEGGTFEMGSSSGESDEQPVHSVTLNSFSIGRYEVTQAQWKSVMGSNPSYFSGCDNCSVENVSWNDVQEFIRKLNAQTGKNYRLPTEAEWEYAAKGGKQSRGYTYSGSNDMSSVGWYSSNSENKTHTVGGKQSNELGIYDMSGNVWEWCSDWYGKYNGYNETNPTGASSGQYHRVLRGGSWSYAAVLSRTAARGWFIPESKRSYFGFRLVLPVDS